MEGGRYARMLDGDASLFGGFGRNNDAVRHLTVTEGGK